MRPSAKSNSLTFPIFILILGNVLAVLIGSVFRVFTHDYMQHDSDAAYFFTESVAVAEGGHGEELSSVGENFLPIFAWSRLYMLVSEFGFPPDPVFGASLNSIVVFVSEVVAINFARKYFDFGPKAIFLYAFALATNGVLMLFSGIHLRDAFLLFFTVISVAVFVPTGQFASSSRLSKFLLFFVLSVLSGLSRFEAFVVPSVVLASSVFANHSRPMSGLRVGVIAFFIFTGALILTALSFYLGYADIVVDNYTAYKELAADESGNSSLAYSLLYGLPFPVGLIFSVALLSFVKFPFWRGMFFDSYSFFISLAGLQMLVVAPLFLGAAPNLLRRTGDRCATFLFLLVSIFLLMVSITSNQVRHLAVVYPFYILAAFVGFRYFSSQRFGFGAALTVAIFLFALVLNIVSSLW